MNQGRCQLCGARKRIRAGGGIVLHHRGGVPCRGSGAPPIEESDAVLEAEIARLEAEAERLQAAARAKRLELEARRANYIPPELYGAGYETGREARRLSRRLGNWRGRHERRRRQLERYGYTL